MHHGEETDEAIVVSVEISVLVGLVARVPQAVDKLMRLNVGGGERCRCRGGDKTYGVAQLLVSARFEDVGRL